MAAQRVCRDAGVVHTAGGRVGAGANGLADASGQVHRDARRRQRRGYRRAAVRRPAEPALVNLDWTTTFTPELLRKDLDLGLELGREIDVPMPVTAAAREVLQTHFGAAMLQKNPEEYLQKDFSALAETMALAAGMKLESENQNVPTGLES